MSSSSSFYSWPWYLIFRNTSTRISKDLIMALLYLSTRGFLAASSSSAQECRSYVQFCEFYGILTYFLLFKVMCNQRWRVCKKLVYKNRPMCACGGKFASVFLNTVLYYRAQSYNWLHFCHNNFLHHYKSDLHTALPVILSGKSIKKANPEVMALPVETYGTSELLRNIFFMDCTDWIQQT